MNRRAASSFVAKPGSAGFRQVTFPVPLRRAQNNEPKLFDSRQVRICLIQSVSLYRLLATIIFAAVAFKGTPHSLVICLYASAMVSDLLDGYLSRKLQAETSFGKVMDLVADKSLTIISLLYAASRGLDILPLALIAMRDIVMIGMRLVVVDRKQLLPTNRVLGGLMALLLWGNTLVLVGAGEIPGVVRFANDIYWGCAVIFTVNLVARLYASAARIKKVLAGND